MDFGYRELLVVLHLIGVVAGIGGVALNGLYGAEAKKAGANGGSAIVRANYRVTEIATWFIYTIPVTGVLLVLENDAWDFDQTWIWLSIVLYVVALGNAHGNLRPSARRMIELTAGPPGPETAAVGRRLAVGGTVNDLITVALLVLMVAKPGA